MDGVSLGYFYLTQARTQAALGHEVALLALDLPHSDPAASGLETREDHRDIGKGGGKRDQGILGPRHQKSSPGPI